MTAAIILRTIADLHPSCECTPDYDSLREEDRLTRVWLIRNPECPIHGTGDPCPSCGTGVVVLGPIRCSDECGWVA